jgi:hypothetical protein
MPTGSPAPSFALPSYQTENAFHGTTWERAESIKNQGFIIGDTQETELRFGRGVYFWENSPEAARRWVRISYGHSVRPAVIRATVRCSRFLDLLTKEHWNYLDHFISRLARELNKPVKDITDAAALNLMYRSGFIESVRLISAAHDARIKTASKRAGPFDVMICVYDPKNVVVTEVEF